MVIIRRDMSYLAVFGCYLEPAEGFTNSAKRVVGLHAITISRIGGVKIYI